MTADLRQYLRRIIDDHSRRRRQAFIDAGELTVCVECGGDLDVYQAGCKHCGDRRRRRARREDPARRAADNEVVRRYRERKAAA